AYLPERRLRSGHTPFLVGFSEQSQVQTWHEVVARQPESWMNEKSSSFQNAASSLGFPPLSVYLVVSSAPPASGKIYGRRRQRPRHFSAKSRGCGDLGSYVP